MKTITHLNLRRVSVVLLLSGIVGASAFAGPGPQFWARSRTPVASTPNSAAAADCTGCNTAATFARHDRGPAGIAVWSMPVAARAQGCTGCGDARTVDTGATNAPRVAAARSCGAMACYR